MIVTTFTVEGRGAFPYDMLRYDHCWPDTTEDAMQLAPSDFDRGTAPLDQPPRRVALRAWGMVGGWKAMEPTKDRWQSFGWSVIECQKRRS